MSDRNMSEKTRLRVRTINDKEVSAEGAYVLCGMIAFRWSEWNYSLQRAVELARQLRKPLLVFEPLRSGYPWASDRLHHFVIQGIAENAKRLSRKSVSYFPYIEPEHGMGKGLLAALAERPRLGSGAIHLWAGP